MSGKMERMDLTMRSRGIFTAPAQTGQECRDYIKPMTIRENIYEPLKRPGLVVAKEGHPRRA